MLLWQVGCCENDNNNNIDFNFHFVTGTNSGFSFMGGSPRKAVGGGSNDSFSFVTDTMKDLAKK